MKWREYLVENIWVWAGTALVLLTLTGQTLLNAVIVTSLAVLLHLGLSTKEGRNDDSGNGDEAERDASESV